VGKSEITPTSFLVESGIVERGKEYESGIADVALAENLLDRLSDVKEECEILAGEERYLDVKSKKSVDDIADVDVFYDVLSELGSPEVRSNEEVDEPTNVVS